ncbi:hypothetical protein F4695_003810 [Rhizobium soli]|uniref:Uncharacterized protein n=1 Tax=Rhizobium soli TaxID=424798 RepID=A0A7X0MTG7_9HYPH|nr:hypothetical protein [Rhizobium soli]
MQIDTTDLRRLFRNRFEAYLDRGNPAAATALDGCPLTLRECCSLLANDPEPFPARYRQDLRNLRTRVRLRAPVDKHTYGDVASILACVLLK